jgi:hypothetical protein
VYAIKAARCEQKDGKINPKIDSQVLLYHTHLLPAACGFVLAIFIKIKPRWRDLLYTPGSHFIHDHWVYESNNASSINTYDFS